MEVASTENSQPPTVLSNEVEHPSDEAEPQLLDHGDAEMKTEITEEELRGILEAIATTGKFWHDWDTLKGLLFFRLKQVLAEYPESQMDDNQQSTSLGETYSELVRRLEEALFSFIEGPPFTLQRLCEILLAARSLYPKLSKLAFALEKILLVTSTLTISTSYASTAVQKLDESEKGSVELLAHSSPLQNGVRPVVGDLDEEMADAEEIPLDNKDEEIAVADKEQEIAEDNKADVTASDTASDVMAADTTSDVMAANTTSDVMAAENTADVLAADNRADVMAADSKIDEVGANKKDGDEDAADHKDGEEDAADHKDAEKEIAEEAITGTSDASSDQNIKAGPSGTASPTSEHLHSTS